MTTEEKLQAMLMSPARRREWSGYSTLDTISAITCADGVRLSVQSSKTHYCSPRDDHGPWHKVEVGFPSVKLDALMPYAETPEQPTETVYGWVPIEVVAAVIDEHGGIKEAA